MVKYRTLMEDHERVAPRKPSFILMEDHERVAPRKPSFSSR